MRPIIAKNQVKIKNCLGQVDSSFGNVGNHGNDRKCHKRRQILNQVKRNNELCLGKNLKPKSSKNKIFREFRVFKYVLLQKNENLETPEINRKLSKSKKHSVLTVYRY